MKEGDMIGIPSPDRLWQRHEQLVLSLFRSALVELKKCDNLPEDEPTLNEYLFLCVRDIYHNLPPDKRPLRTPYRNSENTPNDINDINKPWTKKKPDFLCELHNTLEPEASKAFKNYTIECKRLGKKTGSWDFINQYVSSGIVRFLSEEHSYGRGTTSGAMIGYVQNMEFDNILNQINHAINSEKQYQIPAIVFNKWRNNIDQIEVGAHSLKRKIKPLSFVLQHFWVDLRN